MNMLKNFTAGEVVEHPILHYDEETKEYYLSMFFKMETSKGSYLVEIPKILLFKKDTPMRIEQTFDTLGYPRLHMGYLHSRLGLDQITCMPTPEKDYYIIREIEKKAREMTVEEIEKELGYKIMIVGGDNS